MKRHDTPDNVASALARWAPDKVRTVLEPAVGTGALLVPLVRRFGKYLERVVVIDTDREALAHVKDRFCNTLKSSLSSHCGDFLQWNTDQAKSSEQLFDCIVMNPPFAATKKALVPVDTERRATSRSDTRHVPLEGAFLLKAMRMLNAGGRILAILPGSIIAGDSGQWIRNHLLGAGRIICVHELPRFTFPNVEARVYLFIFERSEVVAPIKICNHRLIKPDIMLLSRGELGHGLRLDYEFQAAVRWYDLLRLAIPRGGWNELKNLASVQRGKAGSPGGVNKAVHTVDFRDGFWNFDRLDKRRGNGKGKSDGLKSSDLLVSRVGRRCVTSLGPAVGASGLDWTDCVFCIRPNRVLDRNRLVFSLRLLFAFDEGKMLVQRGSGATYITEKGISNLLVPVDLAEMYPKPFGEYERAIRRRDGEQMVKIEVKVKASIAKAIARQKRS